MSVDSTARGEGLSTFDVTALVVGSIIGADVYVATAIGARLVGPSSLLVWILAGVMASVIALSFAYCVMFLPKVGGPYAYVKAVAGPFAGFMVGWGLLLAEWFSLAVFPVAFVQYFVALVPGVDPLGKVFLKAVFITLVIVSNVIGIKKAGKVNDLLTLAKLSPLILIVLGGIAFLAIQPSRISANLNPFFAGDVPAFGQALVLIFWAYAGFELSTLPADQVRRPERTIPRSIVLGLIIVIAFYLLTNFIVVATIGRPVLAVSGSPLIEAGAAIFSSPPLLSAAVALIVGVGALLSIAGADESGTIGTSRLAFAMSIDGLLPGVFSRTHDRFKTPYVGIVILCSTAFFASLLGGLSDLINSSVFLLGVAYLATCVSAVFLGRQHPALAAKIRGRLIVPIVGAIFSIVLILLVSPVQMVISIALFAVGVPVYTFFSPKKELAEVKAIFMSREAILERARLQSTRFLAYAMHAARALKRRLFGPVSGIAR
jgi:basic amino acid/polyamine antiporter, APA family